MGAVPDDYVLRPLGASDGPALGELTARSPDTGLISVARRFETDPLEALEALKPGFVGVVAEHASDGLVGAGLLTTGTLAYAGDPRASAYLSGLVVHPEHRRRGLAGRLASWRVTRALDALGDEAVVYAFIQRSNAGSFATAERWANQRLGPVRLVVVPPLPREPAEDGLEVREARPDELERMAEARNRFYRDFLLYPPAEADGLVASQDPEGIHRWMVALDRRGEPVAGAGVSEVGRLVTDHVVHMPLAVRLANAVLGIVPRSGVLRSAVVSGLWFAPGRVDAGRAVWASIRHRFHGRVNGVRIEFDPRSALRDVVKVPPYWPTTDLSVVVRSPRPLAEDRPVYAEV